MITIVSIRRKPWHCFKANSIINGELLPCECSGTVVENYMCIQSCIKAGVSFIPSLLEAKDTPKTLRQNQIFFQQVASGLYLFHQQEKSGIRDPAPMWTRTAWALGCGRFSSLVSFLVVTHAHSSPPISYPLDTVVPRLIFWSCNMHRHHTLYDTDHFPAI